MTVSSTSLRQRGGNRDRSRRYGAGLYRYLGLADARPSLEKITMRSMTIKQHELWQYHRICQAYNTVDPLSTDFIRLSLALHAAKGWTNIPKYMMTAAYVRRCGKLA